MAGNGQYNHNSRIDHIKDYFLRRNYLVFDTRFVIPDLIIFEKNAKVKLVEVECIRGAGKVKKYKKLNLEQYLMLQRPYLKSEISVVQAKRSSYLKHLNKNKRIGKIKARTRIDKSLLPFVQSKFTM